MKTLLDDIKQQAHEAKTRRVHGKFRDIITSGEQLRIKRCYVCVANNVEYLSFSARGVRREVQEFAGVILSRHTCLIESELARKLLPSREWKLLVTGVPKETPQALMLIRKAAPGDPRGELFRVAEQLFRKFVAGTKKLAADIARDI